jgi:uncharacterized protein
MRCASCGKPSVEGQRLCTGCGALIRAACPWCGAANRTGERVCRGCKAVLLELDPSNRAPEFFQPDSFSAGRYQVVRLLRADGAKRVYLADDQELDRQVLVSMVVAAGLDAAVHTEIMRRVRAAARLSGHPRIAAVLEAGQENGRTYVVSEYSARGSLEDALARLARHRLPPAKVVRIGIEVCAALSYAHSAGVVHGDLSCASVILAHAGAAKVSGFGFGVPLAIELAGLTGEDLAIGTAGHVAPEVIRGGAEPRSDLYSLGVMLCELLGVRPPLATPPNGKSHPRPAAANELRPLDHHEVPAALRDLILSLLCEEPERRPASAAAVAKELRLIASASGVRSPVTEWPPEILAASIELSSGGAALHSLNAWTALGLMSYTAPLSSAIIVVAMLALVSAGTMRVAMKWSGQLDSSAPSTIQWPQSEAPAAIPQTREVAGSRAGQDRIADAARSGAAQPARAPASAPPRDTNLAADQPPYQELFELAREGSAGAATALGNIYLRGQGTPRNYAAALHWFHEGASRDDVQAQVSLAYMYALGQGVTQDYAQALQWFTKAAARGDSDAQYDLAMMYEQGQGGPADQTESLKWLRRSAAQDDPRAEYQLGMKYLTGEMVGRDYSRALQWLRKAADRGDVAAQNAVGYIYEKANDELQDYDQARRWYRKAADQGDAKAELNLGLMYENGEGVTPDASAAARWYRMASDQGEAYAQTSLGVLYCQGHGVPRDYHRAAELFMQAASQDEPRAEYNLGIMYDTGLGVAKDYSEAARWYRKAAAQGHIDAQYNLGYLYEHGEGVARNYGAALDWYRKAASRGDSSAMRRIRVLEAKSD